MMDFLDFDLGFQNATAVAVVALSSQANVRLMNEANFRAFQSGRQAQYQGGLAENSPVRLAIPATDHWHVVVDLGGYAGNVQAEVSVLV